MRRRLAAVALGGLGIAACGGDDGAFVVDGASGEWGDVVDVGGDVLAVSPDGRVVYADDDGQLCAVDLDGAEPGDELGCRDVGGRRLDRFSTAVAISPDGSKVALDDYVGWANFGDSDIVVVDLTADEAWRVAADVVEPVDAVTDDDEDDGMADLLPVWVDDDTVRFVRLPGAGSDVDGTQLVTAELDGEVELVDVPRIEPIEIGGRAAAMFDGRYALSVRDDPPGVAVVGIDADGSTDRLTRVDRDGSIVDVDDDGEAALFLGGLELMDPVLVHLTPDGTTGVDLPAIAVALSPDGAAVAGFSFVDDVTSLRIVAIEGGAEAVIERPKRTLDRAFGATWTTDGRIVAWDGASIQVLTLD
jgi:hypothetical protein